MYIIAFLLNLCFITALAKAYTILFANKALLYIKRIYKILNLCFFLSSINSLVYLLYILDKCHFGLLQL